jgi:acetoacetyl-CoA synthetase
VLVSVNAVVYNGKTFDHLGKVKEVAAGLPTLKQMIVVEFVGAVNVNDFPASTETLKWYNTLQVDKCYILKYVGIIQVDIWTVSSACSR